MLDATERTRPIMEYVRTLENKVRVYQNEHRRFSLGWFLVGYVSGATSVIGVLRLLYR